jgi:hypothetical protein
MQQSVDSGGKAAQNPCAKFYRMPVNQPPQGIDYKMRLATPLDNVEYKAKVINPCATPEPSIVNARPNNSKREEKALPTSHPFQTLPPLDPAPKTPSETLKSYALPTKSARNQ